MLIKTLNITFYKESIREMMGNIRYFILTAHESFYSLISIFQYGYKGKLYLVLDISITNS